MFGRYSGVFVSLLMPFRLYGVVKRQMDNWLSSSCFVGAAILMVLALSRAGYLLLLHQQQQHDVFQQALMEVASRARPCETHLEREKIAAFYSATSVVEETKVVDDNDTARVHELEEQLSMVQEHLMDVTNDNLAVLEAKSATILKLDKQLVMLDQKFGAMRSLFRRHRLIATKDINDKATIRELALKAVAQSEITKLVQQVTNLEHELLKKKFSARRYRIAAKTEQAALTRQIKLNNSTPATSEDVKHRKAVTIAAFAFAIAIIAVGLLAACMDQSTASKTFAKKALEIEIATLRQKLDVTNSKLDYKRKQVETLTETLEAERHNRASSSKD